MQAAADLVRGERPTLTLTPGDHHPCRRNPGDPGETDQLPPPHALTVVRGAATRETLRVTAVSIPLDTALELTRTGDLWLFRGNSVADRAIRATTNAPINHVGMAVVLDDLPPLMWHAELGRSLVDMWSGKYQRGVQLHDLRDSALVWANRYGQRGWLRQLNRPVSRDAEDALLKTIARLDGTPFPTTTKMAAGWLSGRLRDETPPTTSSGRPHTAPRSSRSAIRTWICCPASTAPPGMTRADSGAEIPSSSPAVTSSPARSPSTSPTSRRRRSRTKSASDRDSRFVPLRLTGAPSEHLVDSALAFDLTSMATTATGGLA